MATRSKTAKKTPAKKTTPKRTSAKNSTRTTPQLFAKSKVNASTPNKKSMKIRKSYVIIAIIVIGFIALAIRFRSLFIAATVNGHPIYRYEVLRESEKQSGKQVIANLVQNSLIEQEAKKRNITVSDQEVNDEIKTVQANLAKQGQTLDEVLATQGLSRDDLKNLIRTDKLVGKIVGNNVKVTDQQVSDYIDKNKDSLPTGLTDEQLRATVAAQLKQQALSAKVQAWLADVKAKANIQYFVQY